MSRILLASAFALLSLAPAQAWEFAVRNTQNVTFYGELVGKDVTGEITLRALCRKAPRLDVIVRLDARSPDPYENAPNTTASVSADGGAPVTAGAATQAAPSFTVSDLKAGEAQKLVDEIGSARGEVNVAWNDVVVVFDARDAGPAVQGFQAVCDSLPASGKAIYGN